MLRARALPVALACGLAICGGCQTCFTPSLSYRLTHPFWRLTSRQAMAPVPENGVLAPGCATGMDGVPGGTLMGMPLGNGPILEGPPLGEPGMIPAPLNRGETAPPPMGPAPRPWPPQDATRMPYQP